MKDKSMKEKSMKEKPRMKEEKPMMGDKNQK